MISTHSRAHSRRGLTLVEMLVVVALTVLMMTIIAQIFQATTGAIQIARAYQEIEQDLRAVEGTIKRDLAGVTAKFTPPLNPKDGLGYFEYGENEFADAQGAAEGECVDEHACELFLRVAPVTGVYVFFQLNYMENRFLILELDDRAIRALLMTAP